MFKHLIIHKVLNRKDRKKDRISLGYATQYNITDKHTRHIR